MTLGVNIKDINYMGFDMDKENSTIKMVDITKVTGLKIKCVDTENYIIKMDN
jgi:hypothetical protein